MTTPRATRPTTHVLDHLRFLEAESIHILREVAAEMERPCLLFSGGKDSIVMLNLARKAFAPARIPFPVMHVDTGLNFPEILALRDRWIERLELQLVVASVQDAIDRGLVREEPNGSRNRIQTQVLLEAAERHRFDALLGGGRRDEEKSRAKERVFSFRDEFGQWDPKNQRPELWNLYNARKAKGESIRVFPLSNWTELDIWQYIMAEGIEIVPLYMAAKRPTVERDGLLLMVDDERFPLEPGEEPVMRSIRFRTLGCYPLTGAIESEAATLPEVVQEMLLTTTSERQGRAIDKDAGGAGMEKKKQEGYF
jgi:sulfate adenylyltransferase subunit 2